MKSLKLHKLVPTIVGVIALFLVAGAAFGSNISFNFDENCNGTLVSSLPSIALPCSLSTDPVSGKNTVLYQLVGSSALISGDVLIFDPDKSLSDLLRFNARLGGVFVFSSDTGDLADVVIMPLPDITNPSDSINEVDLGGGIFGVNYQPQSLTDPGLLFVNPGGVTYNFTSGPESVVTSNTPEPATYLLVAGSLLLLSLRRNLRTF
jgi:hypothetical protein